MFPNAPQGVIELLVYLEVQVLVWPKKTDNARSSALLYNMPMPPDIQKLLQELKQGLVRLYGGRLKGVYLFGSYARGDFEEGSDLDILVVLDDFERAPIELDRTSDLFCDLSLIYEVTISLMFMREKDWLTADKPLLRNIRVEGVPV